PMSAERTGAGAGAVLSRMQKASLATEILFIYARVRWLLRRGALPHTVARLRAGSRPHANDLRPERCAAAVERTLRALPTDSRCLVRSLVLVALLSRRGLRAKLVIGVLRGPEFGAHAWVEHDGVPLLQPGMAARGRLVEL